MVGYEAYYGLCASFFMAKAKSIYFTSLQGDKKMSKGLRENPREGRKSLKEGWQPSISMIERDLIFRISDEKMQIINWIFQLRSVAFKAEKVPWVECLKYLVLNKMTGNRFIHWIEIEQDRSPVNAVSWLRQKVYSDWQKRAIIAK